MVKTISKALGKKQEKSKQKVKQAKQASVVPQSGAIDDVCVAAACAARRRICLRTRA